MPVILDDAFSSLSAVLRFTSPESFAFTMESVFFAVTSAFCKSVNARIDLKSISNTSGGSVPKRLMYAIRYSISTCGPMVLTCFCRIESS